MDNTSTVGANIYCHNMDTCTPKEYLTLPAGPDENYSHTRKSTLYPFGRLEYSKLGLDLENSVINSWDFTFTDDSGVLLKPWLLIRLT